MTDRVSVWTPTRDGRDRLLWTAVLALVVLVAFALRTYHLDFQSFWRDEVDAVFFSRESLSSLLTKFTKVGENGPLYFTILHYWIALTGDSEFSLRFFSAMFGVVTVPLTYAAGTRIIGRGSGFMAALVAAIAPYYIWYSQEAKMYALLAALTLLSMYVFLKALEENRPRLWLLYVVVTSLSFYVHFFSAFILVCEGAIFLAGIRRYKSRTPGFGLAVAALTLPYLPLAMWQIPMLMNPPGSPYEFLPLDAVGTTLLFAFSVGFTGGGNVAAVSLFTFLLLCATILGRADRRAGDPLTDGGGVDGLSRPGSRWPVAILLLYLSVPLVAFYVISLRYPMFTERYLIIILPAFQILAGAGLHIVMSRSILLFVACLTLLLIFSWTAIYALQHQTIKADFRGAVRYYEANADANDAIMTVMPYMRRSFDYYYRGPYRWVEPPYTNQGVAEEEIEKELQAATGGVKQIWLFVAEEGFWDQRALVRDWLDRRGRLLDDREFVGVRLRQYELP